MQTDIKKFLKKTGVCYWQNPDGGHADKKAVRNIRPLAPHSSQTSSRGRQLRSAGILKFSVLKLLSTTHIMRT